MKGAESAQKALRWRGSHEQENGRVKSFVKSWQLTLKLDSDHTWYFIVICQQMVASKQPRCLLTCYYTRLNIVGPLLNTCLNQSYLEQSLCYLWCASWGANPYYLLPPSNKYCAYKIRPLPFKRLLLLDGWPLSLFCFENSNGSKRNNKPQTAILCEKILWCTPTFDPRLCSRRLFVGEE